MRCPACGEGAFDLAGHRRIEAGEHQLRRAAGRGVLDHQLRDIIRQRRRQAPRGRVAIRLALGALACAEPRDLEPRVRREQRDELLADHAGRAEDPDFNLGHDCSLSFVDFPCVLRVVRDQKKSRRGGVGGVQARGLTVLLTFEQNSPDSAGPLSRVRLLRLVRLESRLCAERQLHRPMSIALSVDAANLVSRVGTAARVGHDRPHRPAVRVGPRLDSGKRQRRS